MSWHDKHEQEQEDQQAARNAREAFKLGGCGSCKHATDFRFTAVGNAYATCTAQPPLSLTEHALAFGRHCLKHTLKKEPT